MRKKPAKRESGQASVMIAMIILTFVLFFAFVVNTGMLVHAKINIQNAADLAAYSGAATQARLLNHVSYLNYEMRRQYKKFLFRYYVIGSFMYETFPRNAPGSPGTPRSWKPASNKDDYFVPIVCINLAPENRDNYCTSQDLPEIKIPPKNIMSPINNALRDQLAKLEEIRKSNCASLADTNLQLLSMWLFNSDPLGLDPETIDYSGAQANQVDAIKKAYQRMKGITYGLGLVPREILLRQRIDTLQGYLNAQNRTEITPDQLAAMRNSGDPAAVERTINAFTSAIETLGENTFPEETIIMDELLPLGPTGAKVAEFKTIQQDFDTYALTFQQETNTGDLKKDCKARAFPITLRQVPLGVYKDTSILTYYAVRLRAKARVLFSPYGDIELKAYAAAMPFGSRIGPSQDKLADLYVRIGAQPPQGMVIEKEVGDGTLFNSLAGKIPNLPVLAGETSVTGKGWDSNFVQNHFYRTLIPNSSATQLQLQAEDLSRAAQASMVPNPWEEGKYNIINDLGNDPFVRNFDKYKQAAIWAPLVPADKTAQINDLIREQVDRIFANNKGSTTSTSGFNLEGFKKSMLETLTGYITKLRANQGEGDPYTQSNRSPPDALREGINVAILVDPLWQRPTDVSPGTAPGPIAAAAEVMLVNPASPDLIKIRDSWNQVYDKDFRTARRVGYSVKFVSFDSLKRKSFSTTADGKGTLSNEVNEVDSDAADDIAVLKH